MGTPSADGLLPAGVRPLRDGDPAELGGHTLLGRLGSGGMGVVYLGRDPLDGLVAVKSAHRDATELAQRFAAEAEYLRRLPEGCTARLITDGTSRTPPYLVTEYVEGRSLAHVVDTGGPLPPEQVHAVATGVLRALAAVHRAGILHRDLKPPNVVLTVTGPRLIDFGIAQEIGASGGPTGPEAVMGSPGWISPECLSRQRATPASDVFGWGCLVVYAATGRNPYGRGDADELARRILTEPPDLGDLEEPLRGLATATLSKDPSTRPSAEELLSRLTGGVPAEPEAAPTADEPVSQAAGRARWRRPVLMAAAGIAAAAALTAFALTHEPDHDVARTPPSITSSTSPPRGTPGTRLPHRTPALRERGDRPRPRPSAPSAPPSAKSSSSPQPPVTVPTLIDPSLPVLDGGQGQGKGRNRGNGGSASTDPGTGLIGQVG